VVGTIQLLVGEGGEKSWGGKKMRKGTWQGLEGFWALKKEGDSGGGRQGFLNGKTLDGP